MLELVDDNSEFLVLDKPPGVSFHRQGESPGLFQLVREQVPESSLFAVHRLDQVTSGLVLIAKSKEVAAALSTKFAASRLDKFYLAVSDRKPKKKQGLIVGDMAKSRRGNWKLLRSRDNPAVTEFISKFLSTGLRLFLLRPLTGKTHQLRVALKSIGAPVLGDPRYHPIPAGNGQPDRSYLHCYALGFELCGRFYQYRRKPSVGTYFIGPELDRALRNFENPWNLQWSIQTKIPRVTGFDR